MLLFIECINDDHCDNELVCDKMDGKCKKCTNNHHCGGQVCQNGECKSMSFKIPNYL